jgi:hypothetical protein
LGLDKGGTFMTGHERILKPFRSNTTKEVLSILAILPKSGANAMKNNKSASKERTKMPLRKKKLWPTSEYKA